MIILRLRFPYRSQQSCIRASYSPHTPTHAIRIVRHGELHMHIVTPVRLYVSCTMCKKNVKKKTFPSLSSRTHSAIDDNIRPKCVWFFRWFFFFFVRDLHRIIIVSKLSKEKQSCAEIRCVKSIYKNRTNRSCLA